MKRALPCIFLILVAGIFFYQSIFFGRIPFPGDMLIAQYVPWKYEAILGFNPGSYPNKAQYFDVLQQLFPWKQLVVDQIQSGKVPLWNPYNFSGAPLLANIQSAVFNPIQSYFFLYPITTCLDGLRLSAVFFSEHFYLSFRTKNFSSCSTVIIKFNCL